MLISSLKYVLSFIDPKKKSITEQLVNNSHINIWECYYAIISYTFLAYFSLLSFSFWRKLMFYLTNLSLILCWIFAVVQATLPHPNNRKQAGKAEQKTKESKHVHTYFFYFSTKSWKSNTFSHIFNEIFAKKMCQCLSSKLNGYLIGGASIGASLIVIILCVEFYLEDANRNGLYKYNLWNEKFRFQFDVPTSLMHIYSLKCFIFRTYWQIFFDTFACW